MIDIDYIAGIVVAALFVAAGGCAAWAGLRWRRRTDDQDDRTFALIPGIGGLALVVLVAVLWFGTNWPPFDMQYHSYKPVSGTVQTVTSRFLADGKGSSQFYVVELVGDPTAYRCDDSRCSLLAPGKPVKLRCIREWQYASVSGWDCNYDQES